MQTTKFTQNDINEGIENLKVGICNIINSLANNKISEFTLEFPFPTTVMYEMIIKFTNGVKVIDYNAVTIKLRIHNSVNILITKVGNKYHFESNLINPIKDNRIVSDKTFATRLIRFLEQVEVQDMMSEEEQKYLLSVANKLRNYQYLTRTEEEDVYFKNIRFPNKN